MKRSVRFCSFKLTVRNGSKPPSASSSNVGTMPAILEGTSCTRLSERRRMPECPAISRVHTRSAPQPSGDTMPNPVMTMRRILCRIGNVYGQHAQNAPPDMMTGRQSAADEIRGNRSGQPCFRSLKSSTRLVKHCLRALLGVVDADLHNRVGFLDRLAGFLGFVHGGEGGLGLAVDLEPEALKRGARLPGLDGDRLGRVLLRHAHGGHTRRFLVGPDRFPDVFIHLSSPVVLGSALGRTDSGELRPTRTVTSNHSIRQERL